MLGKNKSAFTFFYRKEGCIAAYEYKTADKAIASILPKQKIMGVLGVKKWNFLRLA